MACREAVQADGATPAMRSWREPRIRHPFRIFRNLFADQCPCARHSSARRRASSISSSVMFKAMSSLFSVASITPLKIARFSHMCALVWSLTTPLPRGETGSLPLDGSGGHRRHSAITEPPPAADRSTQNRRTSLRPMGSDGVAPVRLSARRKSLPTGRKRQVPTWHPSSGPRSSRCYPFASSWRRSRNS